MQNLIIVLASNRPQPNDNLFKCLAGFAARGTAVIHHTGTTDVALARNISLTLAHAVLKQLRHDIVLMIDDDMVFTDAHVAELMTRSINSGRPTSGCYVLTNGALAAQHKGGKWFAGLGFLAIPSKNLLELADHSERFRCPIDGPAKNLEIIQFTEARIATNENGVREWQGEDYVLCQRLGGVDLAPIAIGHIKPKVLQPSADHLQAFIEEQERT